MDIALKRRLVGASVLVALGVIFIPMLLDGPTEPGRREVAVDLPDEPTRERRRIPITPPPRNEPAEPESRNLRPQPVEVQRAEPPATKPLQETEVAVVEPTGSAEGEDSPNSIAEVNSTSQPTTVSSPLAEPPRAQPTQVAAAEPSRGTGGWVLQLGSFGNAANASKLVQRVSAAGYNAYQESVQVGGRTLHRVRVGHWREKDEAASAGNRLTGQFADLSADLKWDDSDGSVQPASPARGFMVQVGAFGQAANATGLRDRLRGAGFSAHVVSTGSRCRVLVGPALSRAAAESTQQKLKSDMSLSGIVVSHP